jgi:uncharacterized membrane protein YbjE (DUF340 family)
MELLLNVVWAILAGTAVSAFLGSAPARRKQFLLAFGALCCALLLLFPSISVSDDLHFQAFVSEDSNPSKKLVNAAHVSVEHFTSILFVLSALLAGLFRVIGFIRIATACPSLSSLLERPIHGRAPPTAAAA